MILPIGTDEVISVWRGSSVSAVKEALVGGAVLAGLMFSAAACSSPDESSVRHPSSATHASGSAPAGPSAPPTPASVLAPLHAKTYAPTIDPDNFVAVVDNRYWPLKPGTGYHYKGVRGHTPQRDDEVVLSRSKLIAGVTCTVVRDTVSEHGRAVERTFDWYAQDRDGNVWYMGENSLERRHGRMMRASDSWETGVDGAKPGIIMPGNPQPGEGYRQEYYPPGEALDQARVVRLDGSIAVPFGSFRNVLVTSERSPLEPQTEQKYYAPGVGEVAERVVKGHHEAFELVRVTH